MTPTEHAYRLAGLGALLLVVMLGSALLVLGPDGRHVLPAGAWRSPALQERPPSLSGSYLAGQFALTQEDFDSAAAYFGTALSRDRGNEALRHNTLRLLVASGRMADARALAGRTLKDRPEDALAVLVRVGELVRAGHYAQAAVLVENPPPMGIFSLIQPVLREWVRVGQALGDESGAASGPVRAIEGVDMQGFLAPFMQYQRALMNDVLGHEDVAREAYKVAASNPVLTPYRVVQAKANFHLRQGEKEAAQRIYDLYGEHHPDSELMPETLPQGDVPPAQVTPLVQSPAEGMAEIYFTAASLLFGERANEETLLYIRLALDLRPDFPPAQMMLANIMEQHGDHVAAVEVYQSIDPDSLFYRRGRIRIALNYQAAGQDEQAVALLTRLIDEQPDNLEAVMILGDYYRSEEQHHKAVQVYESASERMKKAASPAPGWEFYYKYAIAHERAGNWDEAEALFMKALELEPQQPDVLNYLGYSWLVQGERLKQAKEAIESAYRQRPDAAHIIDSMGWAYYLLGDYDEAVALLEDAAEQMPQDPTINDHLGDAYWRVGRRLEARYQWQRALTFEPEDPDAIRAKLEHGLPESQPLPEPQAGKPLSAAEPEHAEAEERDAP